MVDGIIDEKLAELRERPEGMWLSMMGVENSQLKPMIKPFILGMASDVAPMVCYLPSRLSSLSPSLPLLRADGKATVRWPATTSPMAELLAGLVGVAADARRS